MAKSGSDEVQVRRLKNGSERGQVAYDPTTNTYTLEEMQTHQNKFEFDDIDLAAIEIFDLLDD